MKFVLLFFTFFLFSAFAKDSNWWKHTEIYETFIWSYKDSNNDGYGDFTGLRKKLDYLKELGIRTIKLSPIFPSPNEISSQYGASDFKSIHPTLGTMQDFDEFMKAAKSKGIKVILDIILSHCHITHEWFKKSVEKVEPYTNYFIWKDPRKKEDLNMPPNEWKNQLSHSAWKRNPKRNQYYYNYYNYFLPNLNLDNELVKKEIEEILVFWLNKGVSGFHLLSTNALLKPDYNVDENNEYNKEIADFMQKLKLVIDKFSIKNNDYERILMVTTSNYDSKEWENYAGTKEHPRANLLSRNLNYDVSEMESLLKNYPQNFVKLFTSNTVFKQDGMNFELVLETNDDQRFSNAQISDVLTFINLAAPGTARIHYGQEIGMEEYTSPPVRKINEMLDFRNLHVLPMQWDGTFNAGFTNSKSPIQLPNPNYKLINVEKQKNEQFSKYYMVKNLIRLRRKKTFRFGDIKTYELSNFVFAFTRTYRRHESYIVVTNLDNIFKKINLSEIMKELPVYASVVVSTPNAYQKRGEIVRTTLPLLLRPMSSIMMVYEAKN